LKRLISLAVIALNLSLSVVKLTADELRKAPELTFTIPGEGQKQLSQYHGKVVALEFILTTCPHCQAAARLMTTLQSEYGPRGFQALDLAINGLDNNRTPEQANQLVAAFASNFHVGFPVGWVIRDSFLAFLGMSITEYSVVPQLVLIDRKGYIHYQTPPRGDENSTKEATIRQRIEELLAIPVSAAAEHNPARAHAAH
jgi:thiol-disulfide isomerase/thioredoxin